MAFSDFLADVATWGGEHLSLVIGLLVGLAILVALYLPRRRPEPQQGLDPERLSPAHPSPVNPLSEGKATNWDPPEQSYADRRGAVRREGQLVRVLVASPMVRNGADEGYVLDRSTGGLKLAMKTAVVVGGTLQVRAAHAPDNVGFIAVIVRSCRENGDHFEVGCEFDKTPPWNVLLLFG
jgi:hypothetical protein